MVDARLTLKTVSIKRDMSLLLQVRILSGLQKLEVMKVEITLNTLDNREWWFDLGLSYQRTQYTRTKRVFTIALIFFSVYVRW